MFQTSPIIMTSLRMKDVLNYKQEPTAHAINVEARKYGASYNVLFGSPERLLMYTAFLPSMIWLTGLVTLSENTARKIALIPKLLLARSNGLKNYWYEIF